MEITPVSPRTRGWTHRDAAIQPSGRGFPRARGDGPIAELTESIHTQVSPRTRGWTLKQHRHPIRAVGFPAHAGMDPTSATSAETSRWFPRARGDGPEIDQAAGTLLQVSPRTRGWTPFATPAGPTLEGFPAHAGMDPDKRKRWARKCGFPRARGDGPKRLES